MGLCTEGTIFSGGLVGGGAEYAKPSGTDSKTLEGGGCFVDPLCNNREESALSC